MKFSLEAPTDNNLINTYDDHSIVVRTINGLRTYHIDSGVIITPENIVTEADIKSIEQFTVSDVNYYDTFDPEVAILSQKLAERLKPEIMVEFSKRSIGVEMMAIGAACRTYNLLVAEGRRVILVLQPA